MDPAHPEVHTEIPRSLVSATSSAVGYASSGTLGLAQGAAGVAVNAASQAGLMSSEKMGVKIIQKWWNMGDFHQKK